MDHNRRCNRRSWKRSLGRSNTEYSEREFLYAVWNYNPKTDQYRYVWKSDSSGDPRNAGELGVPAETNHPGDIVYAGAAIDKNDNIWFTSYDYAGELWMFNTTSWMFVRVQGMHSETNAPSLGSNPGQPGEDVWPGYTEGQCMVIDSHNNIWMLAGYGFNDVTNMVWHFNTTSMLWTFVHGSSSTINEAHSTALFGGAWGVGCDIDENDRVWIYGGWGLIGEKQYDDYGNIWTFDTRGDRVYEFENGGNDTIARRPQVVSDDYHPDNYPAASENSLFIDRLDGTLMLVTGGGFNSEDFEWGSTNVVWLYSKSLKQWKLVHGNISSTAGEGAYTNYREPGSEFPHTAYSGKHTGRNFNGDVYIVGGGIFAAEYWRKDIWIIPQDQCSHDLFSCDENADCIEEIVGYSCECKEGYIGDGKTCTMNPVATPVAMTPTSSTPASTPQQKASTGASLLVKSILALVSVTIALTL
jgi:hypothetical protein